MYNLICFGVIYEAVTFHKIKKKLKQRASGNATRVASILPARVRCLAPADFSDSNVWQPLMLAMLLHKVVLQP